MAEECSYFKGEVWDLAPLERIFNTYEGYPGSLIPVLQKAQEAYGYLPKPILQTIADRLKVSDGEIFGVVTFYSQFHMTPRGKNTIRVCTGTACHVRGAGSILKTISDYLGIKPGETTDELHFTLETVACLGACGLAPVMMVNDNTHGRLTPQDIPTILEGYAEAAAEEAAAE